MRALIILSGLCFLASLCTSSYAYYYYYQPNYYSPYYHHHHHHSRHHVSGHMTPPADHIETTEKVIVVDPRAHNWAAYDAAGELLKTGMATAGGNWCPDLHRPCRTKTGVFRINSLGSAGCKSHIFPLHHPGAPMPYCMFFNKNQGLHGSYEVVPGNISHGCVRLHVDDARWIRFNFARQGTKVVVKEY